MKLSVAGDINVGVEISALGNLGNDTCDVILSVVEGGGSNLSEKLRNC